MLANRKLSWLFQAGIVSFSMALCSIAGGQAAAPAPPAVAVPNAAGKAVKDAAASKRKKESNTALTAFATVNASVTVEAGLLPHDSAKDLFGGWVADHFAVVQVTIGNHSRDQQFVLQDIFFDYSHWALSGLYTSDKPTMPERKYKDYQRGTNPGEISSIGALEVHGALKQASVFSPRNAVVNGLVLVGTAAGGFAFLGPAGFTQAVTGYTSAVIPGLQKFWPDRTIDQQSNVLIYGFQDKMVIAKEDPGKTYAFFPIDRFLTGGLKSLYLKDPAVFFNPAELFIDPTVAKNKQLIAMKSLIEGMVIGAKLKGYPSAPGNELTMRLLGDLTSPCTYEKTADGTMKVNEDCNMDPNDPNLVADLKRIAMVKHLMSSVSLNTIRIVISGIMTVDVETVPATLTGVTFDKESEGESFWKDSKDKQTGVIHGRYLTNGTPKITGIKAAAAAGKDGAPLNVDDYIVKDSLVGVEDGSSDTELHFSLQFTKTPIPAGATLTFEVVKTSSKSVNGEDGKANTSETTTSMKYDYVADYSSSDAAEKKAADAPEAAAPKAAAAAAPAIKTLTFKGATATTWQTVGKPIAGVITGTDLGGGTVVLKQITLAKDKSSPDVGTYLADKGVTSPTAGSDATTLNFTLLLKAKIPSQTELIFEVQTKDKDGNVLSSKLKTYITPKAVIKKVVAPPTATKKPGGK
jgi:hypothetical protein